MPRRDPPPMDLATLDIEALRPVFEVTPDRDKPRQLDADDPRLIRRTQKRVMLDARRLGNAIEHIGRLPDPGESFHLVTEKRYSLMHVIPATLQLAAPIALKRLTVITLSFSQANMVDLLTLFDSGQVAHIDFLYSIYFKSNEKDNCERLAYELTTRGCRVFAGLIHAKILLMELDDGRALVAEASANLRSCSSVEQITLTHDRALLEFHSQWVETVLAKAP